MERVFCFMIFIAALSYTIISEESVPGLSQPISLLCSGESPVVVKINPCICDLCSSGLDTAKVRRL